MRFYITYKEMNLWQLITAYRMHNACYTQICLYTSLILSSAYTQTHVMYRSHVRTRLWIFPYQHTQVTRINALSIRTTRIHVLQL